MSLIFSSPQLQLHPRWCSLSFKSTPTCILVRYIHPEPGRSSGKCFISPIVRSWVCHLFLSLLRLADCCPYPEQSLAAWSWPSSTAAVACHCQCSALGSWRWSTFPRPCRSRCRGSWRNSVQPGEAAIALISSRYSWYSWGRPATEPPDQESSRPQRLLQTNHMQIGWSNTEFFFFFL